MYNLTNVPTAASGVPINGEVDGETVRIVCGKDAYGAGGTMMTSTTVGDHMLKNPDALRKMYANDLATAIRLGRDAGYAQAKAEIRRVLGVKASD